MGDTDFPAEQWFGRFKRSDSAIGWFYLNVDHDRVAEIRVSDVVSGRQQLFTGDVWLTPAGGFNWRSVIGRLSRFSVSSGVELPEVLEGRMRLPDKRWKERRLGAA